MLTAQGGCDRSGAPAAPRSTEDLLVQLADVAVAVHSTAPGLIPWLRETFDTQPATRSDGAAAGRVLIEPTLSEEPIEGPLFPCFALDSETIRLPGRHRGRALTLHDEWFGTRYEFAGTHVAVRPARLESRLRSAALRVIRELAVVRALATGGRLQLHTSGVVVGRRAALFAGPKGAGKTTLCARVADSTGAGVIANDRAIVARSADGWEAWGVPTIVRVRPETVSRLPELFERIPDVEYPVELTLEETARAVARDGVCDRPRLLSISPAQFARGLGARQVSHAELGCVALIGIEHGMNRFRARRLSAREAADRLTTIRFPRRPDDTERTVFNRFVPLAGAPPPSPPLAALSAGVPWFEVQLGTRFLSSRGAAGELLQTLLDPS